MRNDYCEKLCEEQQEGSNWNERVYERWYADCVAELLGTEE
ncbi:hypothetical protein BH23CHL5_BH23CHL5_23960 [soil metagenome]